MFYAYLLEELQKNPTHTYFSPTPKQYVFNVHLISESQKRKEV